MTKNSAFYKDLKRDLKDQKLAAVFELETARIKIIDDIINELDEVRKTSDIAKSDLAKKLQTEPANVRRFFTSKRRNPTMETLVDTALALGFELKLSPLPPSRARKIAKALTRQSA